MSTCIDLTTLCRFQDGELDDAEAGRLRDHLEVCPVCRRRARQLRDLGRRLHAAASIEPSPAVDCPDELTLASFAEGRLTGAAYEHVERRLADCPECVSRLAAIGRELHDVERDEPVMVPAAVRERAYGMLVPSATAGESALASEAVGEPAAASEWMHSVPPRRRRIGEPVGVWAVLSRLVEPLRTSPGFGLATVASLVLVLVLVLPAGRNASRQWAAERGSVEPPVVELLGPGGEREVTAEDMLLRWRAVPGATNYTVTVVDESAAFFWQRSTATTSLRLPVHGSWVPGMRYTWWVKALLETGESVTSDNQTFRLRD
jgi:anti-sigma factor RsiW